MKINTRFAPVLLVAFVLWSCVDSVVPELRDEGELPTFHPCEVGTERAEVENQSWPEPGNYHEPGGYHVWSTAPHEDCRQNPKVTEGDLKGMELYATYPTGSDPRSTGEAGLAEGVFPVIVFAHANNDRVCNIFERYQSLHNQWASYGFVVLAVDSTEANCTRGSKQNIEDRIAAIAAATQEIERLNENSESIFFGKLDRDRVIFAGHSRGGGASMMAAERDESTLGVINLQGVDVTAFGFGTAKFRPFPVIGLTAGDDQDVKYPSFEPTEDQLSGPYTWVNINNGIHGYTADSVPLKAADDPQIERETQLKVTYYATVAFLHYHAGLNADWPLEFAEDVLFSHAGAGIVRDTISPDGVFTRWKTPAQSIGMDSFESTDPEFNDLGGSNEFEDIDAVERSTYRPEENPKTGRYSKSVSLHLIAEEEGSYTSWMSEDQAPLSVSTDWALEARVKGPDSGETASANVVLLTTSGTIRFNMHDFIGPLPLSNRFSQVHTPLDQASSTPLEILAVRVEMGPGELFLDDLRFTAPMVAK